VTGLPNGWRRLTPSAVVAGERSAITIGPFGSNLKTVDYRASGVPLVFVRDIRQATFDRPSHYVTPEKAAQLGSHVAEPGDVLITKMGDPPGDATVYTGRVPAVITADCIRMRVPAPHSPRYVAYALSAPSVREQIDHITRGVAQRKISLARFRSGVTIPLAPPSEQRRIVDILEDHLSRLDAADDYLDAAQRRLEAIEQVTLERLTAIGVEHQLGEVAAIQGGIQKQVKRRPVLNTFPFLRVANVTSTGLDLSEVHRIELFAGELARYRLLDGDLLVVEGNGSPSQIGRAATWDGSIKDCVHQNHLIRVRPAPGLLPEYLEAAWNAAGNRRALTALASSTSGLYTLSVSKLQTLTIRVPSPEVQARVAVEVRSIRDARSALDKAVADARQRAGALRRSLLAAAFSGRLTGRVSDMDLAEELVS